MDELRRKFAAKMKALPPLEVARRSSIAVERLADWLAANMPKDALVGIYRSPEKNVWGEADPSTLVSHPALLECHFAFPRVMDRIHGEMDFAIPMGPRDWAKGVYGNPEPFTDLPNVDPHEIDVLIVPGVVFGVGGERIGKGAGFYDRFLALAPGVVRVGFAFDLQVFEDVVPQEEWDIKMDFIITDLRTIETRVRVLG